MSISRLFGGTAGTLATFVASSECPGQCRYEATVLGSPDRPLPYAVNDAGGVVGVLIYSPPVGSDAFLWPNADPVALLPMPSGDRSTAYDISEAGVVVGCYSSGQGDLGFLWDGVNTHTLGFLPDHHWSEARAINENGTAVGFSLGPRSPVAWFDGQAVDLLPLIPKADTGLANDINDDNVVVGEYRTDEHDRRAFLLDLNTSETVDVGIIPNGQDTWAEALNNRRQVVVNGYLSTGEQRTFVWHSGNFTDLGILPGDTQIGGGDINDRGVVVGGSATPSGSETAFLWHRGSLFDLNDLLETKDIFLISTRGITPGGLIACSAYSPHIGAIGVLLTPIEPPIGDVTGDCTVDFDDVLTVLVDWGECGFCIADTNNDRIVDFQDLLNVLGSWSPS